MRLGIWYTLAAFGGALLVGLIGSSFAPQWSDGIWTGALIGLAVQLAGFWVFFVWMLPGQVLLAYGLGMLVRMIALGVVAMAWLPGSGLPAGPTLFSLVGVLFLTTLIEPVILKFTVARTGSAGVAASLTR